MAKETIRTTRRRNFKHRVIGIRKVQFQGSKIADTTSTTTNLYNDKEIAESLYSLKTKLKSLKSAMAKLKEKSFYDIDKETSNLKSLFKDINGVKAAVSAYADVVECSERSGKLRATWEKLNQGLYWTAAANSTGAGCFIREGLIFVGSVREGLMKIDEVPINEEEEEEQDCCAICLEGMKSGDMKGDIEHCDHSFHFVCLNHWMRRKHTCPICRLDMDDQLLIINGGKK